MLKFNIQNQTITRADNFCVVSDSKNYLKASFNFNSPDEWTGTITAVFDYGGKAYCVTLPEDSTCTVPWEVIKPPYFTVSVFCGDLVTADVVSVKVKRSGYKEGETPSEPTPDVYRQILDSVKPPYIGENSNWFVWKAENKDFVDTGIRAEGEAGPQGVSGADGYTPQKGTDYWTEEDKAEIKAYVGDALGDIETNLNNIIDPSLIGTSIGEKCAEFAGKLSNTNKVETFAFFTDPHLLNDVRMGDGNETLLLSYLRTIKTCCDRTPISFTVCGGDWIGNRDTPEEACFKLAYADKCCRSLFSPYYSVMGNHDTNYQGTEVLTTNTSKNIMGENRKDLYYAFDGRNTRFYVLDTGLDNVRMVDDYRYEQIVWLCDMLKNEDKEFSAIICHIMLESDGAGGYEYPRFARQFMEILNLYNGRKSGTYEITDSEGTVLYKLEYDFSLCTGTIKFVLCGHRHADFIDNTYDIPVICTTHLRDGDVPTFDLCIADYNSNVISFVRIGTGDDRSVTMTLPNVVILPGMHPTWSTLATTPLRMSMLSTESVEGMSGFLDSEGGNSGCYPLKKPEGSTKITVTCPGLDFIVEEAYFNDSNVAVADSEVSSGFLESGSEYTFTKSNYGYFVIRFKKVDDTTFDAGYDTSGISYKYVTKVSVDEKIGDIETALDNIIDIQNSLIGGEGE